MLISLFTTPVFALNLSAKDFAIIGYYSSFNSLLSPLILFYMNQFYLREYFKRNEEQKIILRTTIFKASIWFSFVLFILSIIGLSFYHLRFNKNSEIELFPYAILALFPLPLTGIYRLELIDFKAQKRAANYLRISLFNSITCTLFSLLLVVSCQWGATGKLFGAITGPIVLFGYLIIKNKKYLVLPFNWKVFSETVNYCFPLVIAAMLGFVSNGFDRIILERRVTLDLLGFYSIGISIAGYLSVFSTAIGDTFGPDMYESLNKKNFKKTLKLSLIQITLIFLITLIFILFAPIIIKILTANRFMSAVPFARIVALSSISSIIYYLISDVIMALGYTKMFLRSKVIGSILCAFIFYYLINKYAEQGAAWGIVLSYLVYSMTLILLFVTKYSNRIKYEIE